MVGRCRNEKFLRGDLSKTQSNPDSSELNPPAKVSPGQRPEFWSPSIVVLPERAQESSALSARARICGNRALRLHESTTANTIRATMALTQILLTCIQQRSTSWYPPPLKTKMLSFT